VAWHWGFGKDSDWQRAIDVIDLDTPAPIAVGTASALVVSLGVGAGVATLYRAGEAIVAVEAVGHDDNLADDELFREYVASDPHDLTPAVMLELPAGKLALVAITDHGSEALVIAAPKRVAIALEPITKTSWGTARRCIVQAC
jgi:hypothetical protein